MNNIINHFKSPYIAFPLGLALASGMIRGLCEPNEGEEPSALCQAASGLTDLAQQAQGLFFQATTGLSGLSLIYKGANQLITSTRQLSDQPTIPRRIRARRIGNDIQLYQTSPSLKERAKSFVKAVFPFGKAIAQISIGFGLAESLKNFPANCVLSWNPLKASSYQIIRAEPSEIEEERPCMEDEEPCRNFLCI